MGQKSIKGGLELAKVIKARRNELNLTIEEAAAKAGVGTKTWCRYEAGEPIRNDKYIGVCKALGWHTLPANERDDNNIADFRQYRKHHAWSKYIEYDFGEVAAASFVIGSDILLDHLEDDMRELSSMPRGSHIGEIGASWLDSSLPAQFLMRYDYDFLYSLRHAVTHLINLAETGDQIIAHSVIEELALYLIVEESRFLIESTEMAEDEDSWDEWIFDIFEDSDIITFLYSDILYLRPDNPYHFDHWLKNQFFIS